jgi:hypothetical protein
MRKAGPRQSFPLEQLQKSLASLAATSRAVAGAWLNGYMTGRSAHRAFSQTVMLLDDERSALSSQPRMRIDPLGATLWHGAEQLARAIARLSDAFEHGDAAGVRQQLPLIPAFENA